MSAAEAHIPVAEAIRRGMAECSPAERKVARVLLSSYPSAGFETVAKLAARAGVSGPTVLRFANRLGYRGFPDFQQALRDDLDERSASPIELYDRRHVESEAGEASGLARAAAITRETLDRTFAALAPDEFHRAVELLCTPRSRVIVAGGRFSGLLARFLAQHLQLIRPGVSSLPEHDAGRVEAVAGLRRGDVLVLFDYRRYEEPTRRLAAAAKARRASVLLFTDAWLSPISSEADVVLPSETASPSAFDAMTPVLGLVEAVIAECSDRLGDAASARMREVEQAGRELELY
ncbi:DNA-binding MurR/RpiR family transcriptional regulator [Agromyces flavus]|uniref:DNA-binding MurR/RpiR family transcriptional regulator n=1 Tax=Agromyces flavus TaxID=589382 RepID=A0A1H1XKH0_9MICO|nr:MurR/RpiR family transcriptional regulator [Agromyces flavus]MCP2366442.1 DNA-binding MurR/RpiR family transcriptional regulator [Agromyces flavus]GGI44684.1 sugar isomerase [Agromyces flavus]SDT09738.1 DNA-binding transcriptional regulator, MurR/RpiR family, contains HTH and SIS domains [Agromyces flavus]